jgi:uncharacterized membrane protein YeaQ/YmgE (transglycosylase-associated protein family)
MLDPLLALLIVLIIGIVAGLIDDCFTGPNRLTRRVTGSTRGIATSALVGVAGSFVGFNALAIAGLSDEHGILPFLGAAVGAALVLWLWRMIR